MATAVTAEYSKPDLAGEVRAGLLRSGQKELPSKYLYDQVGSELFEVISVLPEYGLTRADERLLRRYSPDIVSRLKPHVARCGARKRHRQEDTLAARSPGTESVHDHVLPDRNFADGAGRRCGNRTPARSNA